MKWDYDLTDDVEAAGPGLFIVNEGNFQYGNASLSFYDPATNSVQNEVFMRANGFKLGDVAQSITMFGGRAWVVVNNSHVVFAINPDTFREVGRITNLTSPRYIHFVSDEKAYISQLYDNRITIVNPRTYSVTGYIEVPGMDMETGSTEMFVTSGGYVYCNCWSYQTKILKIDPVTDTVVDVLEVGVQPNSLTVDKYGRLWCISDGGFDGNPTGYEQPRLYCIGTNPFQVLRQWQLPLSDVSSEIQTNGAGDTVYWINKDIWSMSVDSPRLPEKPLVECTDTRFYGLTVDPDGGDIYVADAIDYQQQGMVLRFGADGVKKDEFYVGVTPGAYCWKR